MAEGKQNINRHLNSAQQWLSEAEQAFDKDSDIRGELNLFLAQAEITHAKEANHSRYWRHKYPVLRHSMAIGMAIVIAAGGMTASYLWGTSRHHNTQSPLQVEQSAPAAETDSSKGNVTSGAVAPTLVPLIPASESNVSKAATDTNDTAASQQPSAPPARREPPRSVAETDSPKDVPLTPDEINKLIRLAGKSLRGQ